jgi:hypothetical protein
MQPRIATARGGNSGAGFVIIPMCGKWFKNFELLKTDTPADYYLVDGLQECRSKFCEAAWNS